MTTTRHTALLAQFFRNPVLIVHAPPPVSDGSDAPVRKKGLNPFPVHCRLTHASHDGVLPAVPHLLVRVCRHVSTE